MKEFKVGDKVYFPLKTTEVCTLVEFNSIRYSLAITLNTGSRLATCTPSGERYEGDGISGIFHATQENKELLEKLYGVEFETPPPKTVSVTLEIPEPFEPKLHEMYWYLDNCGEVHANMFNNDLGDACIKFKWRTKEEAKQALTAFNATFGIPL